jgi:hypothetical protein
MPLLGPSVTNARRVVDGWQEDVFERNLLRLHVRLTRGVTQLINWRVRMVAPFRRRTWAGLYLEHDNFPIPRERLELAAQLP